MLRLVGQNGTGETDPCDACGYGNGAIARIATRVVGIAAHLARKYRGFLKLGSMPEQPDPFTGAWRFNPQLSKLSTQSPRCWIQEILSNFDEVHVRKKIVTADGSETVVSVRAKFDGEPHPVHVSPPAATIVYTRVDRNTISGTGTKIGVVSLTETVTVAPENGTLTLGYSLHACPKVVANRIAVFE